MQWVVDPPTPLTSMSSPVCLALCFVLYVCKLASKMTAKTGHVCGCFRSKIHGMRQVWLYYADTLHFVHHEITIAHLLPGRDRDQDP